jgi:hypothetical protein
MSPEASIGELHSRLPEVRFKISAIRLTGLFCLFFSIAWGLGYPTLNRYDPRNIAGLTDVRGYAALVTRATNPGPEHLQVPRLGALDCSTLLPFSHWTIRQLGPGNVRPVGS